MPLKHLQMRVYTHLVFNSVSSYQKIKIFIVNKKTTKSNIFSTNIVCIGSSHHIFFQRYLICYYALLFLEKQVAICTTTAQYLFKV